MKIIEYKCDLCKDKYTHQFSVVEGGVKAMYFTGNAKFEIKALPCETDNHICVRCLKQLQVQLGAMDTL